MSDEFHKDPNQCQCSGWAYAHPKKETWAYIQRYETGKTELLGHHPSCRYYIEPPDIHLTGLDELDSEHFDNALLGLVRAYSELYWSIHPPKTTDDHSG